MNSLNANLRFELSRSDLETRKTKPYKQQGWIQSRSSDFQKSVISQVLYCSSRNQLSFLFYCFF